jgi:hypothetical protein
MKRLLCALFLLGPSSLWAQQPVTIVNVQAVDYGFDAALTFGGTPSSGPVVQGRTSATEPTNAGGDTRAFPLWLERSGAQHTLDTATANTSAGIVPQYYPSAASTNSTNVKASAGNVYEILLMNTTSTVYWLRFYNLATAPTCSSATGFVGSIPIPHGTGAGGGMVLAMQIPDAFTTGIAFCVTGGAASTDNTNAATGLLVRLKTK